MSNNVRSLNLPGLLVICGIPGAGKSSAAAVVASRRSCEVFSADASLGLLQIRSVPAASPQALAALDAAHIDLFSRARTAMRSEEPPRFVLVESAFEKDWHWAELDDLAELGAWRLCIQIDTAPEVAIERTLGRQALGEHPMLHDQESLIQTIANCVSVYGTRNDLHKIDGQLTAEAIPALILRQIQSF